MGLLGAFIDIVAIATTITWQRKRVPNYSFLSAKVIEYFPVDAAINGGTYERNGEDDDEGK